MPIPSSLVPDLLDGWGMTASIFGLGMIGHQAHLNIIPKIPAGPPQLAVTGAGVALWALLSYKVVKIGFPDH